MLSVSVLAPVVLCYKLAACMYKFPFCEICTDGIIFLILNEGNALRYLVVILFARLGKHVALRTKRQFYGQFASI